MAKLYRCGYCGQPTTEAGNPLEITAETADLDWEHAELTHGLCCAYKEEQICHYVSREMAMDAGDLSLEGMPF